MKDNLEKIFNESLQNYEVPYDPNAWEALSSKLDAQSAGGNSGASNPLKWLISASVGVAILVGGYFLWPKANTIENSDDVKQAVEISSTENTIQSETVQTINQEAEIAVESNTTSENVIQNTIPVVPNTNANNSGEEPIQHTTPVEPNNEQVSQSTPRDETRINAPENTNTSNVSNDKKVSKYIVGTISNTTICAGESVLITNRGAKGEIVNYAFIEGNEKSFGNLTKGESASIKPASNGVIVFQNEKGEQLETYTVKVNSLPVVDFTYEANIFEKGLPVVDCKAYGDFETYKWYFEDKITKEGATATHNFFEKGTFPVKLEVKDANGCVGEIEKTISIHEKYNLMAVEAFKPNGVDPRNQTFMPFSLTERDVKFQLTIIDPINNEVVFSTNNANEAWDGINQRTGKMTPGEKAFIWKVQIFNPEINERPIYTGTIIHD